MSAIATATAQALMHFLWQGALVGLAAWGVLSFLEKARPSTRYAVATAALLLLVALPFATLFQMAGEAPPPAQVPISIAPVPLAVAPAPSPSGGAVATQTFGASLLPWIF